MSEKSKYNPDIHKRKSMRLKDYDYSQEGAYYITICSRNRACIFGEIENGSVKLNEYGGIAYNEWINLESRYKQIELDAFQIMSNHIHGIIILVGATLAFAPILAGNMDNDRAGASPAPTGTKTEKTIAIGHIVGAYKSLVSNGRLKIFESRNEYIGKLWQRNYYEHIIRGENELNRIRQYIIDNPVNWETDENYINS